MDIRINDSSPETGENRSGPAIVRRHRARVLGALALLALLAQVLAGGLAAAPASAQAGPDLGSQLTSGATMAPGQYLQSPNGQYTLQMQGSDGNLVEYNAAGQPLWAPPPPTPTGGHPGAYAVLQGDGNFVVYAADHRTALWASYTNVPNDYLTLQNDGNLVTYTAGGGTALWATMSGSRTPSGRNPGAGDTYTSGQCTWYADNEAHLYTGVWLPPSLGNALTWATKAQQLGWAVGATPRIGSVIVFQPGADGAHSAGHVAWVTAYYPNTGTVIISEMNGTAGAGRVDTRTIRDGANNSQIRYIYLNP
jgi:surface antigen